MKKKKKSAFVKIALMFLPIMAISGLMRFQHDAMLLSANLSKTKIEKERVEKDEKNKEFIEKISKEIEKIIK